MLGRNILRLLQTTSLKMNSHQVIKFKNVKAVPFLKDILLLESGSKKSTLDVKQIEILKLEVLKSVKKEKWSVLNDAIKKLSEKSGETKVALKALEVLKVLKN